MSGERIDEPGKMSVLQVEDHKPDNDVIVEGYVYDVVLFSPPSFDQANNLNEYVEDDFLVGDDAPIIYETQITTADSDLAPVNNLGNYSLYDSESEDSYPRRSARQRQYNRRRIEERQQREETIVLRRHRRTVVESDIEETIMDSDQVEEMIIDSNQIEEMIIDSNQVEEMIIDSNQIEEMIIDSNQVEEMIIDSNQIDEMITPCVSQQQIQQPSASETSWTWSESSALVTPALQSRLQSVVQSAPTAQLSHEICPDSNEDGARVVNSRSALLDFMQYVYRTGTTASKPKSEVDVADRVLCDSGGHFIIPETPTRKKRCRDASEEYCSYKLSRMM